jgi:hypothetical protein
MSTTKANDSKSIESDATNGSGSKEEEKIWNLLILYLS